jgi:hypothetical protein
MAMDILSEEDRKLIISLLNEYSEKLLKICEQIDRQQRNLIFLWLLLLLLAFAWTMGFYWLLSTKITTFITILIITIVSQSFIIYIYFGIQQQKRELLQKASIISAKLEKVIRAASQAQEHTTMTFFGNLEVDLRLSDAEYALQHYKNLVKKRKFF